MRSCSPLGRFVSVLFLLTAGCEPRGAEGVVEAELAGPLGPLMLEWQESVIDLLPFGVQQKAATDPVFRAKVIAQAVDQERPRVAQLPDPFTPMFEGDPQARTGVILWENTEVMFLVARSFDFLPDVLVIPHKTVSFPIDDPALVRELDPRAALMKKVVAAVMGVSAYSIISPPKNLSVRQLHIHILPDVPSVPVQERPKLFAALAKELANRLGPSFPPSPPQP